MASFDIKGLEKLMKSLEALPQNLVKKAVKTALTEALQPLLQEIKAAAPVGATGSLKAGLSVKAGRAKGGNVAMNIVSSGDDYHGGFVEYGTLHMKAQPYMRPAVDAHGDAVCEDALKKIGEAAEQELKK